MSGTEFERMRSDRFRVVDLESRYPDGRLQTKTVIRHPGAVVIVPAFNHAEVCLIDNFRPAVDQVLLELPAGTRKAGEAPEETARRELLEETGLQAGSIEPLTEFFVSPGILDERMTAFVATDLTAMQQAVEDDEWIQPRRMQLAQAIGLIHTGEIQDAKTIAVLYHYRDVLAKGT